MWPVIKKHKFGGFFRILHKCNGSIHAEETQAGSIVSDIYQGLE